MPLLSRVSEQEQQQQQQQQQQPQDDDLEEIVCDDVPVRAVTTSDDCSTAAVV